MLRPSFDRRQAAFSPKRLSQVRLAQGATVDVPMIPFGANALSLGPSSWGFGAPTAIPIPIDWPKTVRVNS